MAARAGSARARGNARREGGRRRDSGRRDARTHQARPNRAACGVVRPAAPVAPTLASGRAFLDAHHNLDLSGIPSTLLVGTPLSEERERTYAALFEHGILPAVDAREGDTVTAVIERALKALAEQYEGVPFGLHVASLATLNLSEFDYNPRSTVAKRNPLCAVIQVTDGWATLDAVEYEVALRAIDREACGAIFERLRRATHHTFEAVTPGWAADVAEWLLFNGEPHEWWEEKRAEIAAELGHEPTALELRRYIRENEIRTPGYITRSVGRHHARAARTARPLSHKRIMERLQNAPKPLRTTTAAVLTELAKLEKVYKALHGARTADEAEIQHCFGGISETPGLIIETTASSLVTEILNDAWEYAAQDRGFSPNLCLILDPSPASCKRLKRTLDALSTATDTVVSIIATVNNYEDACYEHKGHNQ